MSEFKNQIKELEAEIGTDYDRITAAAFTELTEDLQRQIATASQIERLDASDLIAYADGDLPAALYVIGKVNGGVFIQRVRPDLNVATFSVESTFRWMCARADAEYVGVIYEGRGDDGLCRYVHKFYRDDASPENELAIQNALLRIATGFDQRKAEMVAEDVKVLESLGGN